MKQTFDIKRFWKYFLYDLRQMWLNNGRAAIMIGCSGLMLYTVGVILNLVFYHTWNAPGIILRSVVFCISVAALVLYQPRSYGYITDKRAGSDWLMIPASVLEKFISMMIITLIVTPIIFVAVYMCADWLLSLIDPTFGTSLIAGSSELIRDILDEINDNFDPYLITPGMFFFALTTQMWGNFLYFLFFGLVFKKYKLVGALAVLMLGQFLIVSSVGVFISYIDSDTLLTWLENMFGPKELWDPRTFLKNIWWGGNVLNLTLLSAWACGIYFRLKSIKH